MCFFCMSALPLATHPHPVEKLSAAPQVTSWCHRLVSKNFMWGLSSD